MESDALIESNQNRLTSRDPIDYLPYEIWLECLLFAIAETEEGPLPLCNVSMRWQTRIVASPGLWSTISIGSAEDFEARVHTFMHLSGNRGLHLRIHHMNDAQDHPLDVLQQTLRRILQQNAHRIKSFTFPLDSYLRHTISGRISSMRSRFGPVVEHGPYSAATSVDFGDGPASIGGDDNDSALRDLLQGILRLCPNILWVRRMTLPTNYDEYIGPNIRSASFAVKEYIRLPLFDRQTFRTISLIYPKGGGQIPPVPMIYSLASPLRTLRITTDSPLVLKGILSTPQLDLHALSVEISTSMLPQLTYALSSLPALRVLLINLTYALTPIPKTIGLPGATQSSNRSKIYSFALYVNKVDVSGLDHIMSLLESEVSFSHMQLFALETSGAVGDRDMFRILRTVSGVRDLTFRQIGWGQLPDLSSDPIDMPNLWYIRSNSNRILDYLRAPELTHFIDNGRGSRNRSFEGGRQLPVGQKLSYISINSESLVDPSESDHPTEWRNLQHILWVNSTLLDGQRAIHFQFIRTVEFSLGRNYYSMPEASITMFCVSLIRHLGACPHLTTIKSSAYPLWEPLFEALRSRNAGGYKSIQELWLPAFPIPLILRGLTGLLGGDARITMQHMDEIILQRFHDRALDVCIQCLAAGFIHCLHERLPINSPTPVEDVLSTTQDHIAQNYEQREQEVHELDWTLWEHRLRVLKERWKRKKDAPLRRSTCTRHDLARFVPITQYTLHGIDLRCANF